MLQDNAHALACAGEREDLKDAEVLTISKRPFDYDFFQGALLEH